MLAVGTWKWLPQEMVERIQRETTQRIAVYGKEGTACVVGIKSMVGVEVIDNSLPLLRCVKWIIAARHNDLSFTPESEESCRPLLVKV